ncbi:hypothetical protein HN51_022033, partial [Arachis hypogaea]
AGGSDTGKWEETLAAAKGGETGAATQEVNGVGDVENRETMPAVVPLLELEERKGEGKGEEGCDGSG